MSNNKFYVSHEEFEALINAGNNILLKTPDEDEKKPSQSGEYVRDGVTYRKFKVPVSGEGTSDVEYETVSAVVSLNIRLNDKEYFFYNGDLFIAMVGNSCETCAKPLEIEKCNLAFNVCPYSGNLKKVNGWLPA